MSPFGRDTSREVRRAQVRLLRKATPARRFALVRGLSAQVIGLARRGIRKSMPHAGEREALLRFVELHYGRILAEGLRAHLEARAG